MTPSNVSIQDTALQLNELTLRKTTFKLPQDLYRQVKIESAKSGKEMSTIVAEALRLYLSDK